MLFENSFKIKIDSTYCTSMLDGWAFFDKNVDDVWRYSNQEFHSGKIYGLVGEYRQGGMFLSYLLGGKVPFEDLKIYCNDVEISQADLQKNSWNLEPFNEKYKNLTVRKSIEKALKKRGKEDFQNIAERFLLTELRYDRKLRQLSGERWRASAALGYAEGKKIFYAPYKTSSFYYQMCESGLLKVLRELTDEGAIVLLPIGSDEFIKHIADECIYVNRKWDINAMKKRYKEWFGKEEWIHD